MPRLISSDIFTAIGSIMNSAWIRDEAVVYGSVCTAQGSCVQGHSCRTRSHFLQPSSNTLRMLALPSGEFGECTGRVKFVTFLYQVFGTPVEVDIGTTVVIFNPLQVIATRTFSVLFLRFPAVKPHIMWIVLVGSWSFIFAIVIAGPATARIQNAGPYCEHSSYESPLSTAFYNDPQTASRVTGVGYLQIICSSVSRAYSRS